MSNAPNAVTRIMEPEQYDKFVSAAGRNLGAFYDPDFCPSCEKIEGDLRPNGGLLEILNKHNVHLILVSTELHRELSTIHSIRYIPHFVAYDNGKAVGQETGYRDAQSFEQMLIKLYNIK